MVIVIRRSQWYLTNYQTIHGKKCYFTLHTQDYLLVVDYYSKYPEVIPMATKTAEATIKAMKGIFARHGIPNKFIADNMPFNSKKFHQFSKQWNLNYWGIKAKEGGNDEVLALLELRNTPITGPPYSPAQLLMNRRLWGCLPLTDKALKPSVPKEPKTVLQDCQKKQKHCYDKHSKKAYHLDSRWCCTLPGLYILGTCSAHSETLSTALLQIGYCQWKHYTIKDESLAGL